MKITFLIGNGFDLNLGLNTLYSDFIDEYEEQVSSSDSIGKMKAYMKSDRKLWANAEIALGQFTGKFEKGKGKEFLECHEDFCIKLAAYLKRQEERIDYVTSENKIKRAFSQLKNLTSGFPTQEKEVLDAVFRKHQSEATEFQFICFNYTNTLDNCLNIVKNKNVDIGTHRYNGKIIKNSIAPVCHIHGTVNERMIFAVDDESQIANLNIFECEYGALYKNAMIKRLANESFREYTDEDAKKMLDQSQLVYIYGMSIGLSDKTWWNRICDWLGNGNDRHLIIHKHEAPEKGVFQIRYQIFEREQRNNFLNFGDYEKDVRVELENHIHITGDNIFREIGSLV